MQDFRNSELICKITHIHPIHTWPKYRSCMEFSDKLILPYSFLLLIRRAHHPLPPLFKLYSLKSQDFLIVGVLNFSADENHGFFPNWLLKQLSWEKSNSNELVLELLPVSKNNLYPFPALRRIDLFVEAFIDYELCKKALMAYTTLSKGDWLKIMIEEKVFKVYILALHPKNKCLVKDTLFDLNLKTFQPKVIQNRENSPIKIVRKNERRILSLDRTRARFSDIKSKIQEPGPSLDSLQAIPSAYRAERQMNLRYSAYNWTHSPQLVSKRQGTCHKSKLVDKGTESLDLQPWDHEEAHPGFKNRVHASQTPPMPLLSPLICSVGTSK
jgi:hypothetical protein